MPANLDAIRLGAEVVGVVDHPMRQPEQALLDLEQTPDNADLVNSAFRALHTIKGSGAMFGFAEVASFVHEFETAFDKVRKGQREATPELIAVALDAKDHVHKLIADASASRRSPFSSSTCCCLR